MSASMVTFEQPLNEQMRMCLRLEHLFCIFEANWNNPSASASRLALESLLEALNVLDRPDLKSKFTRALSLYVSHLEALRPNPKVDTVMLQAVLDQLIALGDALNQHNGKIADDLRKSVLLNTIRQHMHHPGGACGFSIPLYHLWLSLPAVERIFQLKQWYSEFEQLIAVVHLLLKITRSSQPAQAVTATQGSYQQALDTRIMYQLIRVSLPIEAKTFPEISVGRHRLISRFIQYEAGQQMQREDDVPFQLTCCAL